MKRESLQEGRKKENNYFNSNRLEIRFQNSREIFKMRNRNQQNFGPNRIPSPARRNRYTNTISNPSQLY